MDLSRNSLGDEGALALAVGGAFKGALASLNLFNNHIRTNGAEAIAAAISTSSSMPSRLVLRYNSIDMKGALALANAITSTDSVANVHVDMRSNTVTRREWQDCWEAAIKRAATSAQSPAMAVRPIEERSAPREGLFKAERSPGKPPASRASFLQDFCEEMMASENASLGQSGLKAYPSAACNRMSRNASAPKRLSAEGDGSLEC